MSVFAVYFSSDIFDESTQRLKDSYPGSQHYQISDRFYLVRVSDAIARTVADDVGLEGQNLEGPTGVVFKLNASYAGFEDRAVWEWLNLAQHSTT